MASGKKNYFRHSFFAGSDPKIVTLISNHGKEAYFHYFRLIELCGQQASESIPEKYVFHARTLASELLVSRSRLGHHLLAMQSSLLLEYVLESNRVEILIPNLLKYLGKYESKKSSNTPNKRKENKIKVNEIKEKEKIQHEEIINQNYTPHEFESDWNRELTALKIPHCRGLSPAQIKSFLALVEKYGRDGFLEVIELIKKSDFLKSSSFLNASWVVDEDNFHKILNGGYRNQDESGFKSSYGDEEQEFDELMKEIRGF